MISCPEEKVYLAPKPCYACLNKLPFINNNLGCCFKLEKGLISKHMITLGLAVNKKSKILEASRKEGIQFTYVDTKEGPGH